MDFIEIKKTRSINRPIKEVHSQFADMVYHSKTDVHKGVKFIIRKERPDGCTYQMEVRVLGMKQSDEINLVVKESKIHTEVISGTNPGFTMDFDFKSKSPQTTEISVLVRVPKVGIKKLIAPLFRVGVDKAIDKAFEEDKQDLEAGNYEKYRAKASVSAQR